MKYAREIQMSWPLHLNSKPQACLAVGHEIRPSDAPPDGNGRTDALRPMLQILPRVTQVQCRASISNGQNACAKQRVNVASEALPVHPMGASGAPTVKMTRN